MVIIGQNTLREKLGIVVMTPLKASVLKAHGREDGSEMEISAGSVVAPNVGAVLRAVMTVTAFVPGGDAPGDVDDDVTLTLLSQRPMMFQDSEVEMQHRVGALETAVDDAVNHGLPPRCANILSDIVFRTLLDVLRRALLGDPPARVDPMTVRLQPGARAVRARPIVPPPAKAAWLHEHMANLETAGMVFRNPQAIYISVVMAIAEGSNAYRKVTDYQVVNDTITPAVCPCQTWKTKRPHSRARPHGERWICCKAAGRCR